MQIFWRLILAHLLTDFTLQTNFIAGWKRKNLWGGMAHSLVFLVCSWVLCYGRLTEVWVTFGNNVVIQGWMAIMLLTIFHFLEDEWRVWTIQRLNSPDNIWFFLWDQFIHFVLIFVFFPVQEGFNPEKGILLAILFVLTTHYATIFIYYMEKDFFGYAELVTEKKYYAMTERLVTALSLLLPGYWALSFLGVWIVRILISKMWKTHEFSWINVIIGNLMAVAFGVFARLIYYA